MRNTVLNTVVIALTCDDVETDGFPAITCRNVPRGPQATGLEGGPPIPDDDHTGVPRTPAATAGPGGVRGAKPR